MNNNVNENNDKQEQFEIEKENLKSQIKFLADLNEKYKQRISELESQVEDQGKKINELTDTPFQQKGEDSNSETSKIVL